MVEGGCIKTTMSIGGLMLMVVLGCCVIQTKCDVFASNSTYVVEGVGFGEIKKLLDTDGFVSHMEFDIADPRKLIFSDGYALKSSDGVNTSTLVGSTTSGYLEAKGVAARFTQITGFTQLNPTSILVVDGDNHCLRHVDRAGWQTSPFVGQCTKPGYKDGQAALFEDPYSVIRDQRFSNKLLVTEWYGDIVRQVDTLTRETTTLLHKSGLMDPFGVAYDLHGVNLVVSNRKNMVKCDIKSKSCSGLAGGDDRGTQDGRLKDAQFNEIRELIFLTDTLILVADRDNFRLRIINTAADSVSSVCKGLSGSQYKPAETCSLNYPKSLLAKDDLIYIGGLRSIHTIPFDLQQSACPDDISVSLDPGQSFANVNLTVPCGDPIRVTLPVGDHTYTYNLDQVAECNFTISVTGPPEICPTSGITEVADNITQMGILSLPPRTDVYGLRLPAGVYEYWYGNCSTQINIEDSRIRRRLEFGAQYDIKCSEIEDQMVYSLFISSAQQVSKDIRVLCSGECEKVGDVKESCSNDTVTLRWSTDLVSPAGTSRIPDQVINKILPKLTLDHLLNVVVATRVPPLVYPTISEDGRAIKLLLTEFCTDNLKYDAVTKTCV